MSNARRRIMITKHDGSMELFSLAKLRSCLGGALRRAAGDPHLAEPLARAVAQHMASRGSSQRSSEYVFLCVCSVLAEAGQEGAARELTDHRRLRAARRRRTWVLGHPAQGSARRWRKSALVASLQARYGLGPVVARYLAGRVEEQVFGLGCRLLSRPFLAQLVQKEVLAWGLVDLPVRRPKQVGSGEGPLPGGRMEREA